MYSVRIQSSPPSGFAAAGRVELRSDVNNPPTTVRARIAGGTSSANFSTDAMEGELTYVVPVGDFVEIHTVNESGVPTFTLTTVTEMLIN
jgi:hypothetical protein